MPDPRSPPSWRRPPGGDLVLVETRGRAQPVGRVEIDDDHLDRSVALGLELEPALELEDEPKDRQRRRLAERTGRKSG